MIYKRRHGLLLIVPYLFPARIGVGVAKHLPKSIGKRVEDKCADWFLSLFLMAFGLSFDLFTDLRKNIEDFEATYVFKTREGSVKESAIFKWNKKRKRPMMMRADGEADNPNVTVVFKNVYVLKRYLFSLADQDILELILENDVQMDGNWNYVCKFLFMIRALRSRVGLEQ